MSDGVDGYLVVGRNDRPLSDLYVLRSFLPAVAGNRPRADGWQICDLDAGAAIADSVTLLVDIAAETNAPALLGSVLDTGRAAVEGFSGAGGYWRAVLPAGPGADQRPVEEVAACVARWASAARHTVAAAPIAEFLRAPSRSQVDGMFEELLSLLGLPDTAEAAPEALAAGPYPVFKE
ncbi:hypothetical protein GCM10010191_71590 [Actinomadura vinacea]|uniref:Uncharacterized protein n=1 Tax=Actinomadura vinacea TaxID=115336 RepID=A0ABP5X418_9ACTN